MQRSSIWPLPRHKRCHMQPGAITTFVALQRRTLSVAIMVAVSSTMVTGRCRWSLNVFITRSASCAPVKSDRINAFVRCCTCCAYPRQVQVIRVRLHHPIRLLQRPQEAPVRASTSRVIHTLMPLLLLPVVRLLRKLLLVRVSLLPTLYARCGGASSQAFGRARLDPACSCLRVIVPRFCVRNPALSILPLRLTCAAVCACKGNMLTL